MSSVPCRPLCYHSIMSSVNENQLTQYAKLIHLELIFSSFLQCAATNQTCQYSVSGESVKKFCLFCFSCFAVCCSDSSVNSPPYPLFLYIIFASESNLNIFSSVPKHFQFCYTSHQWAPPILIQCMQLAILYAMFIHVLVP